MLIEIEIEGTTPLLQHAFTDAAAAAATSGTRAATAAGDRGTPKEQADAHRYIDGQGKSIVPAPALFSCIIAAGKFFKNGRSKITTQATSLIPACLQLNEPYYALKAPDGWTVDTRPVRIPATGGRILRHRPCFNPWGVAFTVDLDEKEMSSKLLREIVDAAGKKIGLGDFRPERKGPFGRFVVKTWREKKRS